KLDDAGKTLFVVTQSPALLSCLATAVRAEDGMTLWKRQLGVDCQADPVVLGQHAVVLDRSGSLFDFDAAALGGAPREWRAGGRLVAGPVEEGPFPPVVLVSEDRTSLYEIACPRQGRRLVVRHYEPGKPEATTKEDELTEPLAGTP